MRRPSRSAWAALVLSALLVLGGCSAVPAPEPSRATPSVVSGRQSGLPQGWTTLRSPAFGVAVSFPADWQQVPGDELPYFEGPSGGLLVLNLLEGRHVGLLGACRLEARHPQRPFGSDPRIAPLTVDGQPACLILPSADQAASFRIAEVVTRDHTDDQYRFLAVTADPGHIRAIARTIDLLPVPAGGCHPACPPGQ